MDVIVGGEVDAYCTACKAMRLHNVIAMVATRPARVACRSCQGQHAYRARLPGEKAPRKSSSKPGAASTAAQVPTETFYARIAAGERDAVGYSPNDRYVVDAVIRHPTFGPGIVIALPKPQKVEVQFESGTKLLLHDRAATPMLNLQRPVPRPVVLPPIQDIPTEE